ncbi:MAG TPA: inositol monophosphatase family protein [Spirochaetia bacterium]|nr:inositol monophosphatase family protein [Spirochaetia bacterium]
MSDPSVHSHSAPDSYLHVMADAAQAAGAIIRRHYLSESLEVRKKTAQGDLVSSADLESEREILDRLHRAFPAASVVAEESGGSHTSGTAFYVDPVDGTLNFVHGVPFFAVSIGCWVDGVPTAGVVLQPLSGDLYTAVRGGGAKKNGGPIGVSEAPALKDALIATGWPYDRTHRSRLYGQMDRLYVESQELRALGCASMGFCLLAEGAFDAYWEWDLKAWDMAAGALIVTEAGGTVTALDGSAFDLQGGQAAASNGRFHAELVAAIKG